MTLDELLEEYIADLPEYPYVKGDRGYREGMRDTILFKWFLLGYHGKQLWSEILRAFGIKK